MKIGKILLAIKVASLVVLGFIIFGGGYGLSATGGLWACPFPVPFIMCNVCPVYCTFGQIRVWLFYGLVASSFIMGRVFCGVFCPLGIAQELVAKIPLPKVSLPQNLARALRYFKYVLAVFVAFLVLEATGVLEGLPIIKDAWSFLTMHSDGMRIVRLVSIPILLILAIFLVRAWCRYLCPVGVWMSPFNRFSLVGLRRNTEKCIACEVCDQKCSRPIPIDGDEDVWSSSECVRCLQCYTECQSEALEFKDRLQV